MSPIQAMAILLSVSVILSLAVFVWARVLKPLRPGWLVAEILESNGEVKRYARKIVQDSITVGIHRYDVRHNTADSVFIFRTGWAHRATSFYIAGIKSPKDWLHDAPEINDTTAAAVNKEKFEQHVAADLMTAFRKPVIDAVTSLMLILIGMLGGFGLQWWFSEQNTQKILDAIVKAGGS